MYLPTWNIQSISFIVFIIYTYTIFIARYPLQSWVLYCRGLDSSQTCNLQFAHVQTHFTHFIASLHFPNNTTHRNSRGYSPSYMAFMRQFLNWIIVNSELPCEKSKTVVRLKSLSIILWTNIPEKDPGREPSERHTVTVKRVVRSFVFYTLHTR